MAKKVLIICRRRQYASHTDFISPFVYEQVEQLRLLGIDCRILTINSGKLGYLKAIVEMRKVIRQWHPDIVHAHYGLSGLVAISQHDVPSVITFHGSDLNNKHVRPLSLFALKHCNHAIVVAESMLPPKIKQRFAGSAHLSIVPCGVNADTFKPISRTEARQLLGFNADDIYILFSKNFNNKVKNYPLARAAVDAFQTQTSKPVHLIEFIGYTRQQACWLYNAADAALLTSNTEGSPQFIKEAMLCNCPIVSVDVGDVRTVIADVDGCYMAKRDAHDIARQLTVATNFGRTQGREKIISQYSGTVIARNIAHIYSTLC